MKHFFILLFIIPLFFACGNDDNNNNTSYEWEGDIEDYNPLQGLWKYTDSNKKGLYFSSDKKLYSVTFNSDEDYKLSDESTFEINKTAYKYGNNKITRYKVNGDILTTYPNMNNDKNSSRLTKIKENYYYQAENAFAFITTVNGIKCASTDVGYIATVNSNDMKNMKIGACYLISFRISTNTVSSIYIADYINISNDGYEIPQNNLYIGKPYSDLTTETQADSIHAKAVAVERYYPTLDVYGDRWMLQYTISEIKDGDDVEAHFYYDPNNQTNEKNETIGFDKNKIVIDVRFIKKSSSGSGSSKTKEYRYVGNLNQLRNLSQPNYNPENNARVAIKFRYVSPANNGIPATIKYYPSGDNAWNGDGSSAYILYYTRY